MKSTEIVFEVICNRMPSLELAHAARDDAEAMRSCLRAAAQIIGKVVADDLMPEIANREFPAMTLKNIEAVLQRVA